MAGSPNVGGSGPARATGNLWMSLHALLGILLGVQFQHSAGTSVDGIPFTVTPSRLEVPMLPGEVGIVTMQVSNDVGKPLDLRIHLEPAQLRPSEMVAAEDLAFSADRWIELLRSNATLPPYGLLRLRAGITIPPDTPPGTYHASVHIEDRAGGRPSVPDPSPEAAVGIVVTLEIGRTRFEPTRSAHLSDMGVSVVWDGPFEPRLTTETTLDNTGDTGLLVGGLHTYRAWPGTVSDRREIGSQLLPPGARGALSSTWSDVPLFGRVTVTAELVYQRGPDDLPVILVQRSVWIVPWRLLALTAGSLSLAVIAWRGARRVRTRRSAPAAGPSSLRDAPRHLIPTPTSERS